MEALSGRNLTLSIYRSSVSFSPVGLGLLLAAAGLYGIQGSSAGVLGVGPEVGRGVGFGVAL